MNGEWIWILLALFGIFRLLMLAGKKKTREEQASRDAFVRDDSPPPESREDSDELKVFIDSLTRQFGPRHSPPPPPAAREQSPRVPDPPRPRPAARPPRPVRARPPAPRPKPVSSPRPRTAPSPVFEESVRATPGWFNFSEHPVVQGIILAEILGPPRGLDRGGRLPSDFGSS